MINDDTAINISQEIKDSPYAMQVIQVEDEFKEIFYLAMLIIKLKNGLKIMRYFLLLNKEK